MLTPLGKTILFLFGRTKQDDCQNYIRVLARINDEEMLVCGTNAYNPLCHRYGRNVSHILRITDLIRSRILFSL